MPERRIKKTQLYTTSHDLKNESFDDQNILDHLNTELVCHSDPYYSSEKKIKLCLRFDFQETELLNVLHFMYNGEVNVAQNSLNDFLAAAEELAVKGKA